MQYIIVVDDGKAELLLDSLPKHFDKYVSVYGFEDGTLTVFPVVPTLWAVVDIDNKVQYYSTHLKLMMEALDTLIPEVKRCSQFLKTKQGLHYNLDGKEYKYNVVPLKWGVKV